MSLAGILKPDFLSRVWTPMVTQVRYRNRPNLKRPLPIHYKRARMVEFVKPEYPPVVRQCDKVTRFQERPEQIQEHAYAKYLARRMRKQFEAASMIAVFHNNPCKQLEFLNIRGMLFDADFPMQVQYKINSNVARQALEDTKFQPVLQLLRSKTAVGFCSTTEVSKLLKVLKKMPQFILIGLILEDRLLHRADIDHVANLADLTTVRASLCHTLQTGAASLSQTLLSNQLALSTSLATLSSSELSYSDEKKE